MNIYPIMLLATVENANGTMLHVIDRHTLDDVLRYLDEHAEDSGQLARSFVSYVSGYLGDISEPHFAIRASKRDCALSEGGTKTTVELHAYLCEINLDDLDDTDNLFGITFHPLKPK